MVKPSLLLILAAVLGLASCSPSDQQRAKRDLNKTGETVKKELRKDATFVKEEAKTGAAFVKEQALQARDETQKGVAEIKKNVKEKVREHDAGSDRRE